MIEEVEGKSPSFSLRESPLLAGLNFSLAVVADDTHPERTLGLDFSLPEEQDKD
ncbi:hypothetical protein IOC61_00255 [Halomonas sp. KAO]|uniref:hypothetical protein n=1 Tax=Halomonas sp. KAO TaxID=2783858 RepID=UPI00189F0A56|nr:hypothetical protein [Halomonas sp. KAO]MBF7051761.1 hypothetical protein [Halomonas sp. KAO]